jgi:hypothetical protein
VSFWWWVLIFGGIAVAALGLFAMLGLQLWRKGKVLLADLGRLSAVLGTLEAATGPLGSGAEPAWSPEPLAIRRHPTE